MTREQIMKEMWFGGQRDVVLALWDALELAERRMEMELETRHLSGENIPQDDELIVCRRVAQMALGRTPT